MNVYLQDYEFINSNLLRLYYSSGYYWDIYPSIDFGRIVERKKSLGFTSVDHTGIVLGECWLTNQKVIIHNHPSAGRVDIVTLNEFAQGRAVSYQQEPCTNTPMEIITIGLQAVCNQVPYQIFKSNCQVLTTRACDNMPYSKDVDRIMEGVCKGLIAFVGFNVLSNMFQAKEC